MPFMSNGAFVTSFVPVNSLSREDDDAVRLHFMADHTLQIEARETDPLTITLSDTNLFDGTYVVGPAELTLGVANLVPPAIPQSAAIGDTVTLVPGLWLTLDTLSTTVQQQWQIDGVGDGTFENIANATSSTLLLTSDYAGKRLRVQETVLFDNQQAQTVSQDLIL